MKIFKPLLLLALVITITYSCQEDCCETGEPIEDTRRFVDGRGTATLSGIVNCINGDPKEGITVTITDSNNEVWTQETDTDGTFALDEMPNESYSIDFSYTDNDSLAFTINEANGILAIMKDFILGVTPFSEMKLIDALVYDLDDSGVLTTLDYVLFEKTHINFDHALRWQWRFISVNESDQVTSNSFSYPAGLTIDMYAPNTTADLEYIAYRAGDREGLACDN